MKLSHLLPIIPALGSAAFMTDTTYDQALRTRGFEPSLALDTRDIARNYEWHSSQKSRYIHVRSLPKVLDRRNLDN